jgi:hypothetical protein
MVLIWGRTLLLDSFNAVAMNVNTFKVLYGKKGFIERIWAFAGGDLVHLMEGVKDDYCTSFVSCQIIFLGV